MKNKIEINKLPIVPNICRQILREVWKSKNISIAHVIMRKGNTSLLHTHHTFTEVYHILEGSGILWLGTKQISVRAGTLVEISPGTPHKLKNKGKKPLKHLVISTPPFNPKDVILINNEK